LPAAPEGRPLAVVEAPAPTWFQPAQTQAEGSRLHISARLDPATGAGWIDRAALRLTVIDSAGAIEFSGCPDN
jgi:hypothetical protein